LCGISKNETLGKKQVLLWLFHFLKCPCHVLLFLFFSRDTWWVSREYLAGIKKREEGGRATKSTKIHRFYAMQHPRAGALLYTIITLMGLWALQGKGLSHSIQVLEVLPYLNRFCIR
jgi:hypothetical protein